MYSYKIIYKEKVLDRKLELLEANNRLLYYLNNGLNNAELRIIPE